MNAGALTTISLAGFTVAFFHAAIPTHWLPFVLAGRAQRWSRVKTLLVTALAGAGHVLFTTVLGVLVMWLGLSFSKKVGDAFQLIAGGILILFGLFYLVRHFKGGGHGHVHLFGGHSRAHHSHEDGHEHGTHGGILIDIGHGFVELSVFETNVPPRFRLYFLDENTLPLPCPQEETVSIETVRLDGALQTFHFKAEPDYLESTSDVPEPHAFQAVVKLVHGGHAHTREVKFVEDHEHHHDHGATSAMGKEKVALAEGRQPAPTSDWVAIGSLFALLTFSPCEGFLPVFLSGIKFGWLGFFLLSAILAGATLAGMVLFTWLTLLGLETLKLSFVEKYEPAILGGLLCVLGILVIIFEH